MAVVIRVENLTKKYILRHEGSNSYVALREVIAGSFKKVVKKEIQRPSKEEFLALNNVSFEVNQGERVGIIGRNGAGKSTLLKVLSRITEPSAGRVSMKGRIASLLEVGTGFHPELTGRENIFLNGSILGMAKREIQAKFDEIVAFAEVEQFLDTPVKRYSSGMYVRLAFAVAAHLEPEILIVDEVLAVGDAEFQKKCLGKMQDVSSSGRTILFVSHNMAAIQNLCDKAIYLKKGEVQTIGRSEEVISTYLKSTAEVQNINLADRKDRSGNGAIRFQSVELVDGNGQAVQSLHCGKKAVIRIHFERNQNVIINNLHVAIGIDNDMGQRITQMNNEVTNQIFNNVQSNSIDLVIDDLPLKHGLYSFVLYSTMNNEIADWIQNAGTFHVESGDFYHTGKLPPEGQGNVLIRYSFNLK